MKLFKNRTVLGIFCIAVSLIICFAITPLVNAGLSKTVSYTHLGTSTRISVSLSRRNAESG